MDDSERRAPFDGGQGSGVAVRVDPNVLGLGELDEQLGSRFADGPVRSDVLGEDAKRLGLDRCGTVGQARQHPVDAAGKVDRRRAGGPQALHGGEQRRLVPARSLRFLYGEHHAEGARCAQRRCPAHGEPADRVDQVVDGRDP